MPEPWPKDILKTEVKEATKRLDLAKESVAFISKLIGEVSFVVMRGNVEYKQVPLYLSGADCLMLTSDYEGSPNIIKEALACNLPIVSVDVGDVRERLEGVNPSQIVTRDPKAIGMAMAEIITSCQRSNGRKHVSKISAVVVRDKILRVYNFIIWLSLQHKKRKIGEYN